MIGSEKWCIHCRTPESLFKKDAGKKKPNNNKNLVECVTSNSRDILKTYLEPKAEKPDAKCVKIFTKPNNPRLCSQVAGGGGGRLMFYL